jgi:hypothetical protein
VSGEKASGGRSSAASWVATAAWGQFVSRSYHRDRDERVRRSEDQLNVFGLDAAEDRRSSAVRLDRWLWAARIFRSRSQAAEACAGGKVRVNDVAAKPHKLLRVGDRLVIT